MPPGRFCVSSRKIAATLPFTSHRPFRKFSINSERTEKIMEVHIKIHGQTISVEASAEVGEFLDRARHKSENLAHEKRRHWDNREFDETIVAHECSRGYYETPEDWLCRRETLREIMTALESCTEKQRRRFLLFALEGLSCSQIGNACSCSQYAVWNSIETVRRRCKKILDSLIYEA
jgi:RNA polymerase sigma-70 factor (ECF subfamily)